MPKLDLSFQDLRVIRDALQAYIVAMDNHVIPDNDKERTKWLQALTIELLKMVDRKQ